MSYIPREIPEGAIRYNTDSNKMEVWIGDKWMIVSTSSPNLDGGARACFAGGAKDPSAGNPSVDTIDFVTISTAGNAIDFGDLTESKNQMAPAASAVRGYYLGGGNHPTNNRLNTIEFITFSTTGNGTDFGDLNTTTADHKSRMGGCNSATRGLSAGGLSGNSNRIFYITMTTSGQGEDFGDMTSSKEVPSGCSSPSRGIWFSGSDGSGNISNTIDLLDII